MENFKEIAEKVLNGELKGTFVLKNGCTRDSRLLARNKNGLTDSFPYYLVDCGTLTDRGTGYELFECQYDVVDFIAEDELPLDVYNNNIKEAEKKWSNADELRLSISECCNKVRTRTILGQKYITGFICNDGSELSFAELIGNR